MAGMNLFVPITKVDVARREVWGRLAHEVPDKSGEIFDYASSKPYFEEWTKSFSDATDGKSLGNLRAMHGKVAAGKFIAVNFNDAEKAIDVGSKVVDDNEWQKVEEGVYTGFSIGGSYVGDKKTEKAANGSELKRYTAKPTEGSLVDNPCIPTAKFFDVVKADGTIEKVAFKVPAPVIEVTGSDEEVAEFAKVLNESKLRLADAIKAVAGESQRRTVEAMHGTLDKREFSTDERKAAAKEGAALPDGSFPIKTVSDLANAVSAYGRAKDKAAAKAHIIKRAKALGATDKLPAGWMDKAAAGNVKKGLWNVSSFASCLDSLASVVRSAQYDLDTEGDGSPVPMKMRNAFADLVDCFKALSAEEADEALADLKTAAGVGPDDEIENTIEAAAKVGALRKRVQDPELPLTELAKIAEERLTPDERKAVKTIDEIRAAILKSLGKAMSAADKDRLQAAHDHLAAMGATCSSDKAQPVGDLAKAMETIAGLTKDVEALKKQPMPFPQMVGLRVVKREDDGPKDDDAKKTAPVTDEDLSKVELEPADYIKNADGSVDYFASRVNKAQKIARKSA